TTNRLLTPDGKEVASLEQYHSIGWTFSRDGRLLYGLRSENESLALFSLDPSSKKETIIGKVGPEFKPGSNLNPSTRFSLAPDGRSFVYGAGQFRSNLWMLDGFAPARPTR